MISRSTVVVKAPVTGLTTQPVGLADAESLRPGLCRGKVFIMQITLK